MKTHAKKSTVALIVTLVAALLCCFTLSGCSFLGGLFDGIFDTGSVEFTRRSLSLEVGDEYDLARIIESNVDFELGTSNRNVASISGTRLTARAAGRCTVTAQAGSAKSTLSVTVTENVPDSITVRCDGPIVQTVGNTTPVVFTAEVTGTADGAPIVWSVDDIMSVKSDADVPFVYEPTEAGEYVITASPEDSDLSDSVTVRAYNAIEATGRTSGELRQDAAPYSTVELVAQFTSDPQNPADYIQWFIDGKEIYAGHDKTYTLMPPIGAHTLTLAVNGVSRTIDGAASVDLFIVGSVAPTVTELAYDNLYPHAYLRFDAAGDACVEITSPDGSVKEYSERDSRYADLFTANGFDAGEFVELCATGSSRRTYKFRVKSLGDGAAYAESAYCEYLTFLQLPSEVDKYLKSTYCDKDYYITSDVEFVNLLEYEIISRPKTSSVSAVSFDCYLAYATDGSDEDLWNNAFEIAATSGKYSAIRVSLKNNIYSVAFNVNTVNTPTKQSYTGRNGAEYANQLHAIMPHINYDPVKYRKSSYVFEIDRRERTQIVTYSDELYFAAENNSRPLPVAGSNAEAVYEAARDVLRQIVTDDMTDVEKAHAIYDWNMWQVTYDTPATEISVNGEAYSAYYLEGVFGNGENSIGGVEYYPYAVCDGISKAYSLMCNIEGIPCVRVSGIAGDSLEDARGYGHAWNKVFVNGGWYVVDCTWGDVQSTIRLDGVDRDYELALHDCLFMTDEQADLTHFESYESGDSDIIYAPESAKTPIDVYSTMTYNGVEIDCRIGKYENENDRVTEIARAFAQAYTPRTSVYVPGGPNGGNYAVNYEAIEIYFENGVPYNDSAVRTRIQSAIQSVRPRATVVIRSYDDMMLVLMKG